MFHFRLLPVPPPQVVVGSYVSCLGAAGGWDGDCGPCAGFRGFAIVVAVVLLELHLCCAGLVAAAAV